MNPSDYIPVYDFTAEKVMLCEEQVIGEAILSDASCDQWRDEMNRRQVRRLVSYVLAMPKERIRVSEHRSWPADWWQAFRERWFPVWWLKRWPVRYERLDIEVDEQKYGPVCPHVRVQSNRAHFEFLTMGTARQATAVRALEKIQRRLDGAGPEIVKQPLAQVAAAIAQAAMREVQGEP